MLRNTLIILIASSFIVFSNNGKDNGQLSSPQSTTNPKKENAFIQIAAKKSKKYEIYTIDGTFITDGILDFNSRADVGTLQSGTYLIVVGKKAYQFIIN
jgi:hypothetical protein